MCVCFTGVLHASVRWKVKFENLKILIVDDQASNQVLLTYLLEDDGHQVEGASNGEEAIAKRPSQSIDMRCLT